MKLEELSPRRRRIAVMLAEGKERAEIAQELGISVKTFDTHRGAILDLLGLDNAVQLCRYAIEHGWISVPGYDRTAGDLVDGFDHQPNEV